MAPKNTRASQETYKKLRIEANVLIRRKKKGVDEQQNITNRI